MGVIGWLIMSCVVIGAISAAFFMGRYLSTPVPVPVPVKRFGLTEARAALGYIQGNRNGPQAAKDVLRVVVDVLGYENTIASNVDTATTILMHNNEKRDTEISNNERKIERLQADTTQLKAASNKADEETAHMSTIAGIFSG